MKQYKIKQLPPTTSPYHDPVKRMVKYLPKERTELLALFGWDNTTKSFPIWPYNKKEAKQFIKECLDQGFIQEA